MGTPRYMAPEQVARRADRARRTDLFAAGAILFEMLAGRPAFAGRTVVEIAARDDVRTAAGAHRIAGGGGRRSRDPPRAREAARRAADISRRDGRRAPRRPTGDPDDDTPAMAHALTRLVVLPFRIAAPGSRDGLSGVQPAGRDHDVALRASDRSSCARARPPRGSPATTPDFKALAAEADVDRVVMGTLLRSGDQLRAVAQLVEAPGGTVLTSHTVQSPLGDLFRLQDDIARRVVEALSLPLSGGDARRPSPDAPHNARGVRAVSARERARAIVRRARPRARTVSSVPGRSIRRSRLRGRALGRCHRVIGKYIDGAPDSNTRAEEAFRRALELNPRLTIAHKFYANLEAETGQASGRGRAPAAGGDASRQRSGALRRSRARLPVLRALRGVARRARRGPAARSEHARRASSRRS